MRKPKRVLVCPRCGRLRQMDGRCACPSARVIGLTLLWVALGLLGLAVWAHRYLSDAVAR